MQGNSEKFRFVELALALLTVLFCEMNPLT